jgi:hypothetical protein
MNQNQLTIVAARHEQGVSITISGSLDCYGVACVARELMRIMAKKIDISRVTPRGKLMITDILCRLHDLTDDGRHFSGLRVHHVERHEGPAGRA